MSKILDEKGLKTTWLIKSEDVIEKLAAYYGLPAISMGKKGKSIKQKYYYQLKFFFKTLRIARKYKSRLGMGVSMNLPLVSKFSRMKSICLDDDDMNVTPLFARFADMASVILTPSALAYEKRGSNHLTYPGYHELAYLHPKRFQADPGVLAKLGVEPGETYFIVRFNSFRAHHDQGEGGMSYRQKIMLLGELEHKGKVFISSESGLEPGFESNRLLIAPEDMHSALYYASMYVGESQTMSSEAAVLGTPALKCNTFAGRLSVPNELERKYGLCYSYLPKDYDKMMERIRELLSMPDLKAEWQKRRMKMLEEKIDVTAFLAWFVENYPESFRTMKKDPAYAERFR